MKNAIPKITIAMLLVGGCAFQQQRVILQPELRMLPSEIGQGKSVAVKVVDERPEKDFGHRGSVYGKMAKISSNQDVAAVIRVKVEEGLKRSGFQPEPWKEESPRSLRVEIRFIEYSTSAGYWTGGVHTKSTLKAISSNGGKLYENIYRVENEERVMVVPFADENEKSINDIVSLALQKMFNDTELLTFLASR